MASRRSTATTAIITTSATVSSARTGVSRRSSTAASHAGSSVRRAIASIVRDTPGSRLNSTPSAASAAPMRTTGSSAGKGPRSTTNCSGACVAARSSTGTTASVVTATIVYTASTKASAAHDRPRDRPRRIPHLLAQRRNPRVAGECEEEEPGRAQHVERTGVERRQPAHVGVAGPPSDDHAGEHRQRDGQDEAGDGGGAGQPAEVDDGDPGHRRDGDDSLGTRPEIRPDGQGDGGARGRLADDEPPAGQESPDRSELTASVDVRAAGLRVHRGEARRRRGVAQRDDGGDAESDQQCRSRRRGRR